METKYHFSCSIFTTCVDFISVDFVFSANSVIDALNQFEFQLLDDYYPFHSVFIDPIYKIEILDNFSTAYLSRFLKYGFEAVVNYKCKRIGAGDV